MASAQAETPQVIKVLIGVPNQGHTLVDAYDNRLLLMQHLGVLEVISRLQIPIKKVTGLDYIDQNYHYPKGIAFEFGLATVGNVLTPIARERIAEIAVEGEWDYLFFIDDDMICPPDMFEQLYAHQRDIVGALAFTRFAPHKPVIYIVDEGFDSVTKQNYYTSKCWLTYPKDTLVECDAVGFGAVLINCGVLRSMRQPWFTAATGKGEDIQFCFDAGKSGFKVFMDTSCKLGHLGPPKSITEEIYESETNVKELREKQEETSINLNGKRYV